KKRRNVKKTRNLTPGLALPLYLALSNHYLLKNTVRLTLLGGVLVLLLEIKRRQFVKLLWLLLPLGAKRFCTDSPSWMRNREPHIKQIPMEKQQQTQQPGFLEEVRKLNGEVELSDALRLSLNEIDRLDVAQLKRIGLKTYQEGKWSVHKILQHLNDWERIWCYRAVLFARKEGSVPVGHDQELMGLHS